MTPLAEWRGELAAEDPEALADRVLLRRMRAREESALAALYDRHGTLLYTLAWRILGDRSFAQEVVQDVFLRCWQDAQRYDPARGSVVSWLVRMARNRSIDVLRTRSVQTRVRELEVVPVEQMRGSAPSASHPERIVLADWVRSALAGLSDAQRRALELAYYGGLTQTEIARELGEPLGTVKTRTRSALERLRQLLDPAAEAGRAAPEVGRD